MYSDSIKDMVWSYSRLTSFAQCKYQFYLKYIIADDSQYLSEGNYYAEVGSFVHKILEMIFTDKLNIEDAAQYFVDHFDENVFYEIKKPLMDKTFEACATYFADLELDWLKNCEILGVEEKIDCEIRGFRFTGIIDLLLRDKETGNIIIMDHKSAKFPLSQKTGKVLKAQEHSFESYKKQMYLYCFAVKEKYGAFPRFIVWNHFKSSEFVCIDFEEAEYKNTLDWFENTIQSIGKEEEFQATQDFYYCKNLCEFRASCEYNQLRSDWS